MDLDVTECMRGVLPYTPADAPWMGVVNEIFAASAGDVGRRHDGARNITSDDDGRYGFGCVVSKPGDGKQNWHQAGHERGGK